jgi:benzoyl-CoA reductase/2-hydroxyglutaryl-CoA dehydratase subunit BcrC/BadD/HgdB
MAAVAENQNRINTIIRSCRLIERMCRARPETPKSHLLYFQILEDYYTRIRQAGAEGRFLAAHTIFFPVEIFYSMDIVPMHTELTAWMTALFTGSCADLLAASAEVGMASEICSPYRVLAGALKRGVLPRPDTILWTNLICDNAGKGGDLVMHQTGCQGFFLDCPFKKSALENEYLQGELRNLISYLEEKSGHRLDRDRLSENIARMDRQLQLYREINNLRKHLPSPFPPQDFLKLFTVDCLAAGRPEVTQYLEQVKQELTEKIPSKRYPPDMALQAWWILFSANGEKAAWTRKNLWKA